MSSKLPCLRSALVEARPGSARILPILTALFSLHCGADAQDTDQLAVSARDLTALSHPGAEAISSAVFVSALTQSDAKTRTECAHRWYLRPASGLSECPGAERSGALCYPLCEAGFSGSGPVCWQDCPVGYGNDGLTCRLDADTQPLDTSNCPGYDICGTWHDCEGECPDGYSKTPCTCFRNADIFTRAAVGRGLGWPMSCPADRQQIGALCYENCPAGYQNDGIVCRETRETCTQVPIPEPAPTLLPFCYELRDPGSTVQPCLAGGISADTEEHARLLIQRGNCSDRECSITFVDCSTIQTSCH